MRHFFFSILIFASLTSSVSALESGRMSLLDSVAFRFYCRMGVVFSQDIKRCALDETEKFNFSNTTNNRTLASLGVSQPVLPIQVVQQVVQKIIEKPIETVTYVQGPAGPQGEKGEAGLPGVSGRDGVSGFGTLPLWLGLGTTGGSGGVGATGPAGPAGADGTTTTVYSIATSTKDITATGTITTFDLVATNATSTNFFSSVIRSVSGFFTDLFVDNATTTNLAVTGNISLPNNSISNASLANATFTLATSTGIIGGGTVSLGGTTTVGLSNTGVVAGTYGSTSEVPVITVDAQGRITIATTTTITSSTINSATTSGNILTSTVNSIVATTSLITSNVATSSANILTTIVNGITSTVANIVNSFTQSLSNNVLTTTINGISATTTIISDNTISFATSTSVITSTVNGITSSTSLAGFFASSTTNTASTTNNVITSTVNGVSATTSAVTNNVLTSLANTITSTVNGIASVAASIINSFSQSLSGNILTTTINGVSATSSVIGNNTISFATLTGVLTSDVNGITSTTTLSLANLPGLINLTAQVSGVLPVINGGTGTSTAPTLGQILVGDGLGGYSFVATSSLGALTPPAGSNTQLQFNNSGSFGATSTLVWDNSAAGRLGIGTTSPMSVFAINNRRPIVTLRDNFSAQTWQMRVGGPVLGNTDFDIFSLTTNQVALSVKTDGNIAIGSSTIPANNSRLFVYGGGNGANIDVRGDPGVSDQAVIELEGSDYDTSPNSVRLQYFGPNGLGSTAGFPHQKLGLLAFQGAANALIGTIDTKPLMFITDFAERMRLTETGSLGIGTTTPAATLGIAGNIFASSTATSTFQGSGINLTSGGCFAINGVCVGAGGSGISSLNTLTASTQTFATTTDTNITMSIVSSGSTHTFTPGFTGTLADARVADNLTISGGTIENTPIGAVTPSTAVFTNATTTNLAVSGSVSLPGGSITNANLVNSSITVATSTGVSGGGTVSLGGTVNIGLTSTGVTPGSFNSFTVDTQGRITVASTTPYLSSALTSLNALTASTQTFATSTDTNIGLSIISSGSVHTFTPSWIGTLADARVADNLTISGGTIENTTIGAVTPSTAVFTNATTTNFAVLGSVSGGAVNVDLINNAGTATSNELRLRLQTYSGQGSPANASYISSIEVNNASGANDLAFGVWGGGVPGLSEVLRLQGGTNNVGIGTTSPSQKLSVAGNIFATGTAAFLGTGTSTFAGGVDISGGCFAINGVCVGAGGSGISSLNTLTASTQTFATTTDTNITMSIVSSGSTHTFTPGFTGTLADARVADNLTISGGTIENTPIGAVTPSTAVFTNATTTNLNIVSALKLNGLFGTAGQALVSNGTSSAPTWQDVVGGGGSLQSTYNSGATIETAAGTPVVITETTAAVGSHDLLQLTANPATGGTYSGDALQITMDAGDASGNTGNGLHIIVDQSQVLGYPVLIEDDAGVDLFSVAENGGITVGSGQSRADVTIFGDVIKKGLVGGTALANINSIFVYDTTKDSDGGAWTNNLMASGKSWYTETKDDAIGDPCVVATDDRCGTSDFPKKAVIVSTNDAVYIFDAIRNVMWMKFTQSGGTFALGADTNNNPSGVFALNGVVYVGTNGASGTGMYAIDFFQDRLLNYDSVDRTQGDKDITNRNTTVAYATNAITALSIFSNVVNDVHGAVIAGSTITLANGGPLNGGVFIGAATDDGASIINVSSGKVLRYADGATTDDINQIWITKRGRLYLANETLLQIERYNDIETSTANDATPDDIFDEQAANLPNAFKAAPTFATTPDALWVTERSSFAQSTTDTAFADTVYYGHSAGLTEIHDVITPSGTVIGWSKFYNTGSTTPYMSGTPRGMFSFSETAGDLLDSTIRNSVLEPEVAPTYGVNGVYGTGLSFNGSSQFLCSDANNDGTCDTDTDFNVGLISFHVELWFRHPTAIAGTDVLVDRRYTAFAAAEGAGYTIEMNSSGQIIFGIQDTAATAAYDDSVTSTQSFNDNEWHHLVAVNTDTALCLYIDAKLAVACDTTLAATLTLDASQILFIGADGGGAAGANFWDGQIDDVYFAGSGATVSDSLSQAQVRRKYIAGRQALSRSSAIATDAETFSSTTIGDSAATWVPNEFAGSIVEITEGTGVGQTRRVVSNTATVMSVSPAFTVAPDATSNFEVMPEQLYGATNGVTSVTITDTNVLSKIQTMYVGSSNGSDAGGVTAFQGYGRSYVTDVYHSDAGKVSDAGSTWSGTDADDVTAIGAINGTVAIGSTQQFWLEKVDQYLEQSIDQISNNIAQMQMELLQDGLLGTSPESGFLGGADLAEYYTSLAHLEPGSIVSIDTSYPDAVKSSTVAYQKDVIGIVATRPGIILGGQTETTYPVALVGRVPVQVTTENGIIKAGDRITSSSLAGHGMRATKAGRVLGVALEDMNPEQFSACPNNIEGVTERLCGQVMVFVNLVDYSGMSIAVLMSEAEAGLTFDAVESTEIVATTCTNAEGFATSTNATGLCDEGFVLTTSTTTAPTIENSTASTTSPRIFDRENKIIEYLKSIRPEAGNIGLDSEILTDRLSAAFEVFTPQVITEGLRVDYISALFESVVFKSDVIFFGTPYFTTDTAGFAVVKEGDMQVDVVFEKEYLEKPIVNASMATSDGLQVAGVQTAMVQAIFGKDIRFLIANASTAGFTIFLNKAVDEDVEFNWIALAVKGAKKHESKTATTTTVENQEVVIDVENNSQATTTQEEALLEEVTPIVDSPGDVTENIETIPEDHVITETIPETISSEIVDDIETVSNQSLEESESSLISETIPQSAEEVLQE